MEELVAKYKSDYEDIRDHLVVAKESERLAANSENFTAYDKVAVNNTINITVDTASVIPQERRSRN